jgi:hypothetical protein
MARFAGGFSPCLGETGGPAKVGKIAGVSPASAYKLIADFEGLGILKEITGGQRGRTYMFADYVKLFR